LLPKIQRAPKNFAYPSSPARAHFSQVHMHTPAQVLIHTQGQVLMPTLWASSGSPAGRWAFWG